MKISRPAVVLALFCLIVVATAAAASKGYRPKTERGALVYAIVSKWGGEVSNRYRMDIGQWAERMRPAFHRASLTVLRKASTARSLEAMDALLTGNATGPAAPARLGNTKAFGDASGDALFMPLVPCRIMDTRKIDNPFAAGSVRTVWPIGGNFTYQGGNPTGCGVPWTGVVAVILNVTVVSPSSAGYATVFPIGAGLPTAASVNYSTGEIVNNQAMVPLVHNGEVNTSFFLYSYAATHIVVDVVGYFRKGNIFSGPLSCFDVAKQEDVGSGSSDYVGVACPTSTTMTQLMCNAGDNPNPDMHAYSWRIFSPPQTATDEGRCWHEGSGTVTTRARCCKQTGIY